MVYTKRQKASAFCIPIKNQPYFNITPAAMQRHFAAGALLVTKKAQGGGAFRGGAYRSFSIPPRQLQPQIVNRLSIEHTRAVLAEVEVLRGGGERVFCAVGEAVAV